MDIVSRLRKFMEYRKIPITQFADSCGIPRPTLSQLLNGRNKKVSDELIRKIHDAFPSLSVLWLMFGEGNMLTNANMQTSEPQMEQESPHHGGEHIDDEPINDDGLFSSIGLENFSEKFRPEKGRPLSGLHSSPTSEFAAATGSDEEKIHFDSDIEISSDSYPDAASESTKKIVNIIVYYNDNSFESFIPGHVSR